MSRFYFFFYSFHPYLFFNQDHTTLTFLGFNVDANGNLYDPDTNNIIKRSIMTNNLYQDLNRQMQRDYMTLSTNYALLNRSVFCAVIYFWFCIYSFLFSNRDYWMHIQIYLKNSKWIRFIFISLYYNLLFMKVDY